MSNDVYTKIKEQVMEKIKMKAVTPRSRAYFIFSSVIFILVFILVLGAVFFIGSFIIAMVRESGGAYLPEFGFRGLRVFLISLPWILIVSALILFFVVQSAARRFRFAYRRPILITLLGVALIALTGSVVLAETRLHRRALEAAEGGRLPVIGKMYRHYGFREPQEALIGILRFASGTEYSIETRDGKSRVVIITSSTRFRNGFVPEAGDLLFAIGQEGSRGFSAFGIREVAPDDIFLPPRIRGMHRMMSPPLP